ncbi:MAG: hypothetical protein M1828_004752 [Chrysothrix sp. TS-e1954]|nr:MAG: hypothetical protein M1828_004752 [Chrysothrix sp. TS-e1954]
MTDGIVDDKSPICIPFLLSRIDEHKKRNGDVPFFLGLNGVQGVGKTTLVTALQQTLSNPPHNLQTLCFSIDDLYLPRAEQQRLSEADPENSLLAQRGQPGTHDLSVGLQLFTAIRNREPNIKIPSYDKSAFQGKGDRADESQWSVVNKIGDRRVEVVLFEGWCVGFRALDDENLAQKWRIARRDVESGFEDSRRSSAGTKEDARKRGRLATHRLQHLRCVNESLQSYDHLTAQLDAFIHLDAEESHYVYDWRLEQEAAMRASKGSGMSSDEVVNFVNGYYPGYELYTQGLRAGIFFPEQGKQLRLVIDESRRVARHEII